MSSGIRWRGRQCTSLGAELHLAPRRRSNGGDRFSRAQRSFVASISELHGFDSLPITPQADMPQLHPCQKVRKRIEAHLRLRDGSQIERVSDVSGLARLFDRLSAPSPDLQASAYSVPDCSSFCVLERRGQTYTITAGYLTESRGNGGARWMTQASDIPWIRRAFWCDELQARNLSARVAHELNLLAEKIRALPDSRRPEASSAAAYGEERDWTARANYLVTHLSAPWHESLASESESKVSRDGLSSAALEQDTMQTTTGCTQTAVSTDEHFEEDRNSATFERVKSLPTQPERPQQAGDDDMEGLHDDDSDWTAITGVDGVPWLAVANVEGLS